LNGEFVVLDSSGGALAVDSTALTS
jgi:hypothetical protein